MNIQAIKLHESQNYYRKGAQKSNHVSFNGYINGNYYKDDIIALAKKYRYSSDWKQELRTGKETIDHAIENWHNEYGPGSSDDCKAARIITGITSLGLSEVLMGTAVGIGAAVKNRKIEKMINEIAKCIDDLNKSY